MTPDNGNVHYDHLGDIVAKVKTLLTHRIADKPGLGYL
jgi:hypothetical protein